MTLGASIAASAADIFLNSRVEQLVALAAGYPAPLGLTVAAIASHPVLE